MQFIDLKTQYSVLKNDIQARIQKVLEHGQYILGPEVRELEEKLEVYTEANHCITCASGTEALLISLMALGVGRGDEIITTPFTFVATAEVIVLLGATPVFVDIEPDTCNIDPNLLESRITPRTKAIIPVSLYGQPADMDEINAIAARHGNIPVIEDAAQSFGAEHKGRKSCNLSTIGCTSFFPSKPLGCYGDGGAIFTNDATIAQACREIRVHGQSKRYWHTHVGVGGRMDTLQCAILLAKLERFDWEVQRRQEIGARYSDLIMSTEPVRTESAEAPFGIKPPHIKPYNTSVFAQYTVQLDDRDEVIKHLNQQNIPTAVHYPVPLHQQPAYAEFQNAAIPVSERVSQRVVSLPMHPDLTEDDQRKIILALRSFAK